jgi:hypothetical protein
MEYVLLIYGEEENWSNLPADEQEAMYEEYFALTRDLRAKDKLLASNELHSVTTATTVAVRNGEALVTDGPFAETKEVLGGYFVIDAESLDEAIEWAERIPTARTGRIEIRPAVDHTQGAAA